MSKSIVFHAIMFITNSCNVQIQSETKLEGVPFTGEDHTSEAPTAAALMERMPFVIEMVTDVLRNAQSIMENDAELDKEIDLAILSELVPENTLRGDIDPNHGADMANKNFAADVSI